MMFESLDQKILNGFSELKDPPKDFVQVALSDLLACLDQIEGECRAKHDEIKGLNQDYLVAASGIHAARKILIHYREKR